MSRHTRQASKHPRTPQHTNLNQAPYPWGRVTLAVLLAIALFVGVAAGLILRNINNLAQNSVLATDHLQGPEIEAPVDSFEGRPVNILVVGIDSRYGDNGELGAGTTDEFDTILSDANLLVHLSADRQSATFMSVPRDLMVDIPECPRSNGTTTYAQFAQFNWSFSFGAGTDEDLAAGINCTELTLENLTDIDVDGFVLIDFSGFSKLIDTLGGVEVCIDDYIIDPTTGLDLQAGCHELNGEMGLKFARVRKEINIETGRPRDGSDIVRIGRQQQLLGAMVAQVLDSNMFTDLPKLYTFVQEAMQTAGFSNSLGSWRTDAALLNSMRNTPRENIRFVTVPWETYIYDINRVVPEEPLASELFASIREDGPLPAGIIYKDLDGQSFLIGADGESIPLDENGDPITPQSDDESTDNE